MGALATGALLVACGRPPPPQAPDLGALSIAPPSTVAPKAAAPPAIARPEGIVAWIRIDDGDALLDVLGASPQTLAGRQMPADAIALFEAVDLHRSLDLIVVATGRGGRDVQAAARFGLREPRRFFDALGKHFDVVERGDRVHVREKSHAQEPDAEADQDAEDVFVCDLAGAGGERATCGTPKAMKAVGEWLRSAPEPRAEDSVRTGKGAALARVVVYGSALRRITHSRPGDGDEERSLLALLEDVDTISLDFAHEEQDGGALALVAGVRLRSASSTIAKELLAPPNTRAPNEPFFRMWKDTSAVMFTPGGGSLPKWTAELADSMNASYEEPSRGGEPSAAAKALGKALEKPVTIGYGVRVDQAKTALSVVRTAKDVEKAMQALERALEPYVVYAVEVDPGAAERVLRDAASTWTSAAEARDKKYRSSSPSTRYAVRVAPGRLGPPKGSFFLDITEADASRSAGPGAKTPTKTEHVVHVPVAGNTWGLTCPDEKTCVDGAKRLLAPASTARREVHPMFRRPGVALAGYASSFVGAFTMHRMSLGGSSNGLPTDVLAELERDLASPRLELPFVVTTETNRDGGGTVAFEMRGEREAFRVLAEHAGVGGNGSGLSLLFWAALALGR